MLGGWIKSVIPADGGRDRRVRALIVCKSLPAPSHVELLDVKWKLWFSFIKLNCTYASTFICECGLAVVSFCVCRLEDSIWSPSLPSIGLRWSLFTFLPHPHPRCGCQTWWPKNFREFSCFRLSSSYGNAVIIATHCTSACYLVSGGLN